MSDKSDGKVDALELMKLLELCYKEDGIVDLVIYLKGFRSLIGFFRLLGTLFGFMAADVESKVNILEKYINSNNGEHYITVQAMIEFEKVNGITSTQMKTLSGSRVLLRLHWALEFILSFLDKVRNLKDDDKLYPACQDSYYETIGKRHSWLIQQGVCLAMRTLPTPEGLARQTCIQHISELREVLPNILSFGYAVFDAIQKLYKDNDILDLP